MSDISSPPKLCAVTTAERVVMGANFSADVGPNIVSFALNTTNRRGEPVYRRSGFMAESRFNRACARYASPDLAQEAFLAAGGPERDRQGMDPDGDGFACYWDPAPFRQAAR